MNMKINVFCDLAPYILVGRYQSFGGPVVSFVHYSLKMDETCSYEHMKMKAAYSFETLVTLCQTTLYHKKYHLLGYNAV
jgi:hypothetical protein